MSVNKAILLGHLGKDPDVRYLEGGVAVCRLSLATTKRAQTLPNGTQIPERTEWHNIVVWRGIAEAAKKYLHKGDKVYVEGEIRSRSFEDKNGVRHTVVEIFAESMEMVAVKQQTQHASSDDGLPC